MGQSKLKSVEAIGTSWESRNGKMYNQTVEFEDGTKGTASSKTPQAKWVVGDEYTFETTERNGYTNITGIKPVNGFGGGGGSKYDSTGARVGMALNKAVDIYIAGKCELGKVRDTADWLIGIAEELEVKHKK